MKKYFGFRQYGAMVIGILFSVVASSIEAQNTQDSLPAKPTLSDCIHFALANQPLVKQTRLDEDINRQDIRIALSGWLPQLNADANLQHNIKLPVSFSPNASNPSGPKNEVATGLFNTSAIMLSANQIIYNTDLFFAVRTASDLRTRASQNTQSVKTDLVLAVSKAFYDVLLTEQQLNVLDEDIQRLERNYKDAFSQYQSGLTDKTDFQRATIALNNTRAQRKTTGEAILVKYAYMKQLIGCSTNRSLKVMFDTATMEREIAMDTLQGLKYENRIEYQLLQTDLKLQNSKSAYYKWGFLPSLSAFANDNVVFQNDQFSQLYNTTYPNSNIGAKLSLPIFQGTKRLQSLRKADLQYKRLQLEEDNMKNQISSQYIQAMAAYKSNLNELLSAKENIALASDIFNTVKFQYNKGIKTYLEVIVSETDLRSAQLNYLNTLFQVLASKLDVQKVLGNITIN
jgi:outer membrane protein